MIGWIIAWVLMMGGFALFELLNKKPWFSEWVERQIRRIER